MNLRVLVLFCAMSGCASSGQVSLGAVESFVQAHYQPSQRCLDTLFNLTWTVLPYGLLVETCQVAAGVNVKGCSLGSDVWVLDASDETVREHEKLHVLLGCELADSDASHNDVAWELVDTYNF